MLHLKRLVLVLALCLSTISFAASAKVGSFDARQVKDVQQIVHDYLLSNPEILLQAWQTLQQREAAKQEIQANKAIKANFKQIFYNKSNPVAGNPNGKVTLVEFFDYQCVHCREMGAIVEGLIEKNKNLRIVFKDWPIFGGNSILAAKAAFAANKQGKYLPYHNLVLTSKPPLDAAKLLKLAKKLKLNLSKFKTDMNSSRWNKVLKANAKVANKLKLVGTPAFIIGNRSGSKIKFIPGVVTQDVLQEVISTVAGKS